MLVAVLAMIALAATAVVVIRDAHPPDARPAADMPVESHDPVTQPEELDQPTMAIDMTEFVSGTSAPELSDPPTQTIPIPVGLTGAQAAAILPYPAIEPAFEPAAFVPAGRPHLQPDPDRLIQTEVVIEDVSRARKMALARLVIGLAASGAIVGLGVVGLGRAVVLIVRALTG